MLLEVTTPTYRGTIPILCGTNLTFGGATPTFSSKLPVLAGGDVGFGVIRL